MTARTLDHWRIISGIGICNRQRDTLRLRQIGLRSSGRTSVCESPWRQWRAQTPGALAATGSRPPLDRPKDTLSNRFRPQVQIIRWSERVGGTLGFRWWSPTRNHQRWDLARQWLPYNSSVRAKSVGSIAQPLEFGSGILISILREQRGGGTYDRLAWRVVPPPLTISTAFLSADGLPVE